MKTILFVFLLTFGIILLFGIIRLTRDETETQKYETLYKKDNFEIRFYPQAILASVTLDGSFDNSRNTGFGVLAGYIFGGNKEEQKIAMTSPVRMNSTGAESTMSFVIPSNMEFDKLPEPVSKQIVLHQSQPVYTASIRFGGNASDKVIEEMKSELEKICSEFGLEYKTNFEYLGYNPPYQVVNRRNEVMVELSDFPKDKFDKK